MNKTTNAYQPKTGYKCTCKPGIQRDNCATCEGTGEIVDFAAIRAKRTEEAKPEPVSEYDQQASAFLEKHGIKFRATLSDSKAPSWGGNLDSQTCGHHYRVTLSRHKATGRMTFDFWSSVHDLQKGIRTVSAYSVLACIASDCYTPETFEDFCAEYGYEADSIKSLQLFNRCSRFAKRLRAFFTESELEALQEIR